MRFLREICGVNNSRIKVFIYCYANQDIKRLTHFWRKKLKVPTSQFTKPYVRTDFRKGKENKMPYGLVHIRYNDKKLLFLVKQWIKEYKDTHCVGTQVVNEDAL